MKETEITCDWIDRYNDDELNEIEKSIFQKRMLANPLLRSEVDIDACLNRFLVDDDVLDLMGKIKSVSRRKVMRIRRMNYLLIAASVLCFAIIGGMFYLLMTNMVTTTRQSLLEPNQHNQKQGDDPAKVNYPAEFEQPGRNASLPFYKATLQGLMAKYYEPLSEFELLIGSVTRSHQFKLISPQVNDSIPAGTEVLFEWRDYDKMVPVSIIIMDNHGIPVSEIPLNHASSYILQTDGFREGLYYWKIMMDDDMVLMGKLAIF